MYIRLDSFSGNSYRFFENALKEMDNRGIWKMVLDLRNNPGGEVFQAVSIARLLVREGIITTLDFKSEKQNDIQYLSYLKETKYLPAVLVNGNSASASEILASAIQESRDGFLIGTQTYGKGVVQNLYPILTPEAYKKYQLEYGQSIVNGYDWINQYGIDLNDSELIGWSKVTTGHYLTRDGNRIDGKGLVPDFPVEDYELVNGIDVQAINLLVSSGTIELNGAGNDVFSAEKILRAKGFELDNPDSVLDAQTCEFLKQFQQENDIAITGVLDDPTKQALNLELDILRKTVDKQYAKAIELLSLLKY
jgi:carboxyl-terminal processing protease